MVLFSMELYGSLTLFEQAKPLVTIPTHVAQHGFLLSEKTTNLHPLGKRIGTRSTRGPWD
jgi:hypothetical protein